MKTITLFILVSVIACSGITRPNSVFAEEITYLDITSPQSRKVTLAVPWFVDKISQTQQQPLSRDLAQVLSSALQFHGIISIISPESYGGSQTADWKQLNSDYVALCQYSVSSESLTLEMRLLNVASGNIITAKSFRGPMSKSDEMLFRFCDSIIKELTGEEGIALSQIAFVSLNNKMKEAYITDILGAHFRQVTRHHNLVVSPRFTPDGLFLSYTSFHTGNQILYLTDLRQSLSTRPLSQRRGMNLAPAWAPDGQSMIVTLSIDGNPDLFLLDNRGNILDQLTKDEGANVSASYASNGKQIVFVSDRSGKPQLFLMNLANKNVQRLTFIGQENTEPDWSPKEDLIVYSSLIDGIYQIFTVKPDPHAEPTQITKDLTNDEQPVWSPDGKQIAFSRLVGGGYKIYAVLKNGTFERQLFSYPGSQSYPRWARLH
ncbi:MAG: protein TolB [Desulfocapsaceae bacterium]|nr:protein TolB [Desulfocapsaceae bacterium]